MPILKINHDNENALHFLTMTVIEWIDVFTKPQYFKVIIDSLKYCQANKGLRLFEFVIMTNHLHLIARAKDGYKLSQIVSDFKKHTTREIIKLLAADRRHYILSLLRHSFAKKLNYDCQLWQDGNYPEIITTESFLFEKVNYIHLNPVRKGYVDLPEQWHYSSAHVKMCNDNFIELSRL